MNLNKVPSFVVRQYLRSIRRLEKKVGYSLSFPSIPNTWINELVVVDLTKPWKKFGLDATGVDYFTLGSIQNGISSRFDPRANQYQSWLGGYVVRFRETREWSLQDHFNLAVVDQTDWLRDYGDPNPFCELPATNFREIRSVQVSGFPAKIYEGGGYSHTDLGPRNRSFVLRCMMAFVATMLNIKSATLRLVADNFLPQEAGHMYEKIYLKGYIVDVEVEKDVRCVLYGNGVVFKDAQGKEVNTFEVLKDDILATLLSARIQGCG